MRRGHLDQQRARIGLFGHSGFLRAQRNSRWKQRWTHQSDKPALYTIELPGRIRRRFLLGHKAEMPDLAQGCRTARETFSRHRQLAPFQFHMDISLYRVRC